MCATRLGWNHLDHKAKRITRLADLVDLVHDGDAATRRSRSKAYQESRQSGLHAHIWHVKQWAENDQVLYQAIARRLDVTVME